METEKFERALEFREILDQAARSPFRYFEKWPIVEVWERCLKAMGEREKIYKEEADWAEKWINALLERNVDREIREKLLSWYVFTARGELAVMAIEFAISLWRNGLKIWPGELTKLIADKLLKGRYGEPGLYWKLPSLRGFIEGAFNEIKKERKDGYFDDDWYSLERMLRIIVTVEDFSFSDRIEEIILALQEGKIRPYGSSPYYIKSMHLAALRDAKKILAKAKREKLLEEVKK